MTDAPLVLPLEAVDPTDPDTLARVGGKAANLGELIRAGFPVPPGSAYHRGVPAGGRVGARRPARRGRGTRCPAAPARAAVLAVPIPDDVADAVRRRSPATGRSRCARRRRPRTCRTPASPASRTPTSTSSARTRCSTRCAAAGRRCGPTAPSPTAPRNGIDHRDGPARRGRPADGRRRGRRRAVHRQPGHRPAPPGGHRRQPRPRRGRRLRRGQPRPLRGRHRSRRDRRAAALGDKRVEVRPVARRRHRTRREGSRRRGGLPHRRTRSARWPRSGTGSRRTTARRRTPSGRSTADGHAVAHPGPADHHALPAAGPGARTPEDLRVYFCFSVAQGCTGRSRRWAWPLPAAQRGGRAAARVPACATRSPAPTSTPRPASGCSSTSPARSAAGRAARSMPRVLDVMEARSAAILRRLLDDPRLSLTRRSPLSFVRPGPAHRAPLPRARDGRGRPGAIRTRHARAPRGSAPSSPDAWSRARDRRRRGRSTSSSGCSAARSSRWWPASRPSPPPASACSALAGRLLGDDAQPGELQTVLRGLPHNVTTEMDLALWALAERIRDDPAAARRAAGRARRPSWPAGYRAGALPADRSSAGSPTFLRRYGHRAVAEIDLGLPRWSDDPTHILGVLANYLRLDDPALAPGRRSRAARARGRGDDRRAGRPARGGAGRLRGSLVRFALDRARRPAGLREMPKFFVVRRSRPCAGQLAGGRRGAGAPRAPRDAPTTSSSSTSPRSGRRSGRSRTCAPLVRRAARGLRSASCAAGTCRASCSPTARSRRPRPSPPAPPTARCVGTAGLRRRRDRRRAGDPRPGRRAPRAGRDPGRAVHRPRLDAALPDRRRAGDGDGRRRTRTARWSPASTASRRSSASATPWPD